MKIKLLAEQSQSAIDGLKGVYGVDNVEILSPQRLRIIYDVTKVNWETICEQLAKIGIETKSGRFTHLRNSWRAFIEQNTRDNLNYKPACCSKPPAGASTKSHSRQRK